MEYGKSFTYEEFERNRGRVVFSSPAGTGKTTACAEYISKHYMEETYVFVSQTINALNEFEQKLLDLGVPKDIIFNYNSSSDEVRNMTLEELDEKCRTSQIVLISHSRLQFDSPYNYGEVIDNKLMRDIIFIDESVNPIITATIDKNRFCREILNSVLDKHPKFQGFSLVKELNKCNVPTTELTRPIYERLIAATEEGLYTTPQGYGMEISDGERSFSPHLDNYTNDVQVIRRLKNLYLIIAQQIAGQRYTLTKDNQTLIMTIPLSIPENWYNAIRNICVLDATGYLYNGFYYDFNNVRTNNWNFNKITNLIIRDRFQSERGMINSLSKTQLIQFSQHDIDNLLSSIPLEKYKRIYFVTFKGNFDLPTEVDDTDAYFKDIEKSRHQHSLMQYCVNSLHQRLLSYKIYTDEKYHEGDNIIHITNYGRTRGSNAFRNCDCVICVGNFRYNPAVMNSIKICYPSVSDDALSVANFLQEIYRTRIRGNESIDIYSFNDIYFTKCLYNEGLSLTLVNDVEYKTDEQLQAEERRKKFLTIPTTKYHKALIDCFNKYHCISIRGIYEHVDGYQFAKLKDFILSRKIHIEDIFDNSVEYFLSNINHELRLK